MGTHPYVKRRETCQPDRSADPKARTSIRIKRMSDCRPVKFAALKNLARFRRAVGQARLGRIDFRDEIELAGTKLGPGGVRRLFPSPTHQLTYSPLTLLLITYYSQLLQQLRCLAFGARRAG